MNFLQWLRLILRKSPRYIFLLQEGTEHRPDNLCRFIDPSDVEKINVPIAILPSQSEDMDIVCLNGITNQPISVSGWRFSIRSIRSRKVSRRRTLGRTFSSGSLICHMDGPPLELMRVLIDSSTYPTYPFLQKVDPRLPF